MSDGIIPTNDRKRANRRIALIVFAAMMLMAGIVAVYTLATQDYRRGVDSARPDLPSLRQAAWMTLAIFSSLVVTASLAYLLFRGRKH